MHYMEGTLKTIKKCLLDKKYSKRQFITKGVGALKIIDTNC